MPILIVLPLSSLFRMKIACFVVLSFLTVSSMSLSHYRKAVPLRRYEVKEPLIAQDEDCCTDDDEVCQGCASNCRLFGGEDCSHCCSDKKKKEPLIAQDADCCNDDDKVCEGCASNCRLFGGEDCSHCCSDKKKREPLMAEDGDCCNDDDEVCEGCVSNCRLFGGEDCSHCCSK